MSATISEKQLRRFYFPAWNACAKANGWTMRGGRLQIQNEEIKSAKLESGCGCEVDELRRRVWAAAEQMALQGHRAVTAEDLRHGCTVVALSSVAAKGGAAAPPYRKIYKSSKDLTNRELDRVVCLFRLLTDADDVGAMLDWQAPERGERKRVIWAIENAAPEAYVARIASDRFGTELWSELGLPELRQLLMTLKGRQRKWNERGAQGAQHRTSNIEHSTSKEANCPF